MQVALLTTFVATKKEPLSVLLERIHGAFLASGLSEPSILFTFSDAPVRAGSDVCAGDRGRGRPRTRVVQARSVNRAPREKPFMHPVTIRP
jgi:hypothetical protein